MRAGNRIAILLTVLLAMVPVVQAVEDGLGTNHIQNLKVYNNIILDGVTVTNWTDVAASTLTNSSISTSMLEDGAVTADKIDAAVAGDGLVGGGGVPLAVGAGSGISVTADAVAVDGSVVRTNGAQSIDGVKTFTSSPVVPSPSGGTDAANKDYVDDKLSSSVADGTATSDTLRWNGSAWTNTAALSVDASGNTDIDGTLNVGGAVTMTNTTTSTDKDTGALVVDGGLGVEENINVGGNAAVTGTLGVTGDTTLGNATASGNVSVEGNTILGNAATDTITFTGVAASTLDMDGNTIAGLAAPSATDDAATKQYVDDSINGLSWKQAVRAASTVSIADLSTVVNGSSLDDITLATGDRILIKNQGSAVNNGIYVVKASGTPDRANDLTNTAQVAGAAVFVAEGTANAGTAWVTTTPTAAPGTDAMTFAQFASPGTYAAGDGLNLNSLTFSVNATNLVGNGLEVDGSNNIRIAAAAAGTGLTGGGASDLAVNPGTGLEISGNTVQVDSTVIVDTGAQSIGGVKTFTSFPVTPSSDPTADYEVANKAYVDGKVSSSVSDGTAESDTLRWDDTAGAWTNTAALSVDASGNTDIDGTLTVAGVVALTNTTTSTSKDTGAVVVEGGVGIEENLNVGGTLGATGATTLGDTLAVTGAATLSSTLAVTGDTTIDGNTTLGSDNADTITFNGKAANALEMDSNKITGLAAPTADTDAAHKLYVDNAINGLSWKDAVRAATTNNVNIGATLSGVTIDTGITLAEGDRVLVKSQGTSADNGIYLVNAGAPTRVADLDSAEELAGAAVFVAEGTHAGSAWVVNTPNITLGTDPLTFVQFASPGTYSAGDGLTLDGNLQFDISAADFAGEGLEASGGDLRIAAAAAGNGLTGGGGSALEIDNTVVVTMTGAQSIDGVKTFTSSPVVPSPSGGTDAANKAYVDGKLSSSVADGVAASETLRWDGSAWTNTAALSVDASGNTDIDGTLTVAGAVSMTNTTGSTNKDTGALVVDGGVGVEENINVGGAADVTGNAAVGGTLDATGATTLGDTLAVTGAATLSSTLDVTGNTTVDGNTTLGDDKATDTVTVNAKTTFEGATVHTPTATLDILAGTGITATHIQNSYLKVRGNGGSVDITNDPQIALGTAGQMLTLQGMADGNPLKLDDGTGLALDGGISFTLQEGHIIQFIYDGTVWRETFRTVPAP